MSETYSNMFFNQPISILDSTASTLSSASLFLYGGATVSGNSNLFTTNISGITTITNSTEGVNDTTGALVVFGGIGTKDNLYVKKNAIITGSLTAGSFAVENLVATTITVGNLYAATKISSASFYAPLATISNIVATAMSSGSLDLTGLTVGTILATSQISAGSVYAPLATISNVVATATSTGSIDATGMTVATILATSQISAGSLYAPLATISNIVATTFTSGSIIANTIDITPSLGDISKERSFAAANNQSVSANVTNFAFANGVVRSFNAVASVSIVRLSGTNYYANYDIRGVQKDSNDWVINVSFVGDNTGIVFTIDDNGQIQYTSSNVSQWQSTAIKFRANTTSI